LVFLGLVIKKIEVFNLTKHSLLSFIIQINTKVQTVQFYLVNADVFYCLILDYVHF